jgi:hypothetical protein
MAMRPTRATVAAAIAVVAATGAGGSVAAAAPERGTFSGATVEDDHVSLAVDRRGRVRDFSFEAVTLHCTDGDEFDTPTGDGRLATRPGERLKVNARGRWKAAFRDPRGWGWNAAGAFSSKGARVTGTLQVRATFDEQNRPNPEGSVHCESEKLAFTAQRR